MTCTGACQVLRGIEKTKKYKPCGGSVNFIEEMFVNTNEKGILKSLFYVLENGKKTKVTNSKQDCVKMHLAIQQLMGPSLIDMKNEGITEMVKIHLNNKMNVTVEEFLECFGFKKVVQELEILKDEGDTLLVQVVGGNDEIIRVKKTDTIEFQNK